MQIEDLQDIDKQICQAKNENTSPVICKAMSQQFIFDSEFQINLNCMFERNDDFQSFDYSKEARRAENYEYQLGEVAAYLDLVSQPKRDLDQYIHHQGEATSLHQALNSKRKVKQVNRHPIKNCLAFFKSAHFIYLKKKCVKHPQIEQLRKIASKKGPTKADFVFMYRIKELEDIWRTMFESKFLFQYIINSRAFIEQKKVFQGYVQVFQTAFEKKQMKSLCLNIF